MTVKLALIGDLHYTEAAGEYRARRDAFYRLVLGKFFAHPADMHIALGDVTHTGAAGEWEGAGRLIRDLAAASGRTFHFVLGNHDTLAQSKRAVLDAMAESRFASREWPLCRALFLDTTKESSPADYGGAVDEEQLEWLDSVAAAPSKPTLVFGHHPFERTTTLSERPMMRLDDGSALAARLQRFGPRLVYFNGHNHSHSVARGMPGRHGWTFVQSASALCAPSFRTIEVGPESVRVQTVVIGAPEAEQLAAAVRAGTPGYWHNPEAPGGEADREVHIAW